MVTSISRVEIDQVVSSPIGGFQQLLERAGVIISFHYVGCL